MELSPEQAERFINDGLLSDWSAGVADLKPAVRGWELCSLGDAVYGLGLIGALAYYIPHAHGFWAVVLAVLKSLVWPAFLVYDVLRHVAG